ncbi:MAG: hypothetical protein ABI862_14520 [Ilumatobacteraceae bacterium]
MPDAAIDSPRPSLVAADGSPWRLPTWAILIAPVLAAILVIIATRHDPLLSPDSITYLSVADHIRAGHGLTDFTDKPLAVFGPVYPLLLSPGGRSLIWATIVGVASIAIGSALMGRLLHHRVRPVVALAGALAFGASQGFVRMASVVWSEAPYAAISLATLVVLSRRSITTRVAAIGGVLAGIGFLTRYAGIGLVATGVVMIAASAWRADDRAMLIRRVGAFVGGAIAISSLWVIRNLVQTGQPLGPRFEGGTTEPLSRTLRLALIGTGHIVVGDGWSETAKARIGTAVLVGIALLVGLAVRSRKATVLDVGIAAFALTSFVVPIIARRATANDIELRVMSPMLIPVIYLACVTFDRMCTLRSLVFAGTALLGWWMYQGVAFAARFPDLAPGGAGYKAQFAPQLYDVIDALPDDARILTNNPQRVWWFTDREPTSMGFTRPRPGNSHYPLDAHDTVQEACSGHAYLAWFDSLQNAGASPDERRPDLAALVDLQLVDSVPGGALYVLAPLDTTTCGPTIADSSTPAPNTSGPNTTAPDISEER